MHMCQQSAGELLAVMLQCETMAELRRSTLCTVQTSHHYNAMPQYHSTAELRRSILCTVQTSHHYNAMHNTTVLTVNL